MYPNTDPSTALRLAGYKQDDALRRAAARGKRRKPWSWHRATSRNTTSKGDLSMNNNVRLQKSRPWALLAALLGLIATAISLIAAPAASALSAPRVYLSDPGATCTIYPRANYNPPDVVVSTRNPAIYAMDFNVGYGNDWQWVRFRTRLVDQGSGVTVQAQSWSGFAKAFDNRAPAFSGEQSLSARKPSWNTQYRVAIDVEWWSQTEALLALSYNVARYTPYLYYGGIINGWAAAAPQSYC